MSDCPNDLMRDRLPELANGLLSAAEAGEVRAHVANCAACAADLAALETARLVLMARTPALDLAAITRAVTAPAPGLRVERGGAPANAPLVRKSVWRSRQFLAAAASLLIVASLSIPALSRLGGGESVVAVPDPAAPVRIDTPAAAPAPSTFAVSEGLGDLSSDDLSTLLAELDRVEATVTAEPASLRQPIVDTPEGY